MTWTVSRRIIAGFALILTLGIVLAALGVAVLNNAQRAYQTAQREQVEVLRPALEAESAAREATVQFQRYLLSPRQRFLDQRDSALAVSVALLDRLRESAGNPAQRAAWEEARSLLSRWDEISGEAIVAAREGRRAEALQMWETRVLPLRLQLREVISRQVAQARAQSDGALALADATADRQERLLLLGTILVLLVGFAAGLLLNRAVSGPLSESTAVLASSAAEILASTAQQASSAAQTSAAVVETSATVDEVTQTAEQATERARMVADSAQRAAEIGRRGRRAVEESATAMANVRDQVESIADSILALAEQAQAIGEIISTVNEIAEQTNLLALNAAVEAARAGEHGRGFAVVAGEVRSLADQSKKATVQVRQILGEIQRATSAAVMTTERGTQQVSQASTQVEQAGETIRTLAEAVTEAAHAAAQIAASAGQQAAGMEQIRQAMGDIHQATQQTLSSTRQAEQTAQDLNQLGGRLLSLVGGNGSRPVRSRAVV